MYTLSLLTLACFCLWNIDANATTKQFDTVSIVHNALVKVFEHANKSSRRSVKKQSLKGPQRPVIKSRSTDFFRLEYSYGKCDDPQQASIVHSHPFNVCVPAISAYNYYLFPTADNSQGVVGKYSVWELRSDGYHIFGYDDPFCTIPSGYSTVALIQTEGCIDIGGMSISIFHDNALRRPHTLSRVTKYFTMKDCIGAHINTYVPINVCIFDRPSYVSMIYTCDGDTQVYYNDEECRGSPDQVYSSYSGNTLNKCNPIDYGYNTNSQGASFGILEKCGGRPL